jgi:hypothetical protein
LLVSWFAGDRCGTTDSDEDHGRSRRPGAEGRRWLSSDRVLGGRMIERLGDVVCGLHHAQGDKERGFIGSTSKPRSTIYLGLASKSVALGFSVWTSQPVATV